MSSDQPLLVAEDVHRTYGSGRAVVHAVAGVSLTAQVGEVVALMGPSGCGKSTLLHLLGGLDAPDAGTVSVAGTEWQSLRGRALAEARRRICGFVFQNLALLGAATAYENVEVPLVLAGTPASERAVRVNAMLELVGVVDKAHHLPDQLSGGQQQRIGIARALILDPQLVLADEPTGSLDRDTGQAITRLLVEIARETGAAMVVVTHDPAVAAHAQRTLHLQSGRLADPDPSTELAGSPDPQQLAR